MSPSPVERLFSEVLTGPRDLGVLDQLLSPAYLDHTATGSASDRSGVRPKLEVLRAGFADITFILEAMVSEGDMVAARWHWKGTHTGIFMGFEPTGREVSVSGMDFYRVTSDRICEHWNIVDQAALLAQRQQPIDGKDTA